MLHVQLDVEAPPLFHARALLLPSVESCAQRV
jgi:hypothetical protein